MLKGLEKSARVSRHFLENLGQRAARYFLEDKAPLNHSIEKMAQEHSLNSESIKRVCEMANVEVEGKLFTAFQKVARARSDDDLYYPTFDTADADKILRNLSRTEKTASVNHAVLDDYDKPTLDIFRAGLSKSAIEEFSKIAFVKTEEIKLDLALEKLNQLREEVVFSKLSSELNISESAHTCYNHIKQQVLRGADIKTIYKGALRKQSKLEDKERVKDLFQFAAKKLVDEGVVITNDRQAVKLGYAPLSKDEQDAYITDLFETPEGSGQVSVLNGSYMNDEHPLFSELDILVKQHDEADRYDKALIVIDDKIKYVKRKMLGDTIGGA
jgi:hypothetical protein